MEIRTKTFNKLIAEFMGFQKTDIGWYDSEESMPLSNTFFYDSNTFDEHQLAFHTSWDWLMPVISKCAILNNEEGFEPFADICELDLHSEHPTYKEVIRFIKLFNQTKN